MALPELTIRPAVEADVLTILALIRALAAYEKAAPGAVPITETLLRESLFGTTPAVEGLVARLDGEAAGIRPLLPQFLKLAGTPRPLSGRPVRSPRASPARHRKGVAPRSGPHRDRARLRPHGVAGTGLESPGDRFLSIPGRSAPGGMDHVPDRRTGSAGPGGIRIGTTKRAAACPS